MTRAQVMTTLLPARLRALRTLFSSPASTSPTGSPTQPRRDRRTARARLLSGERSGVLPPVEASCAGDDHATGRALCGQRTRTLPGFLCVHSPHADGLHFYQDQDDYLAQQRVTR